MSGVGRRFLNHSNIEAVLIKRQPGDSPRTTKPKRLLFLCPLMIKLIHSAINFPNISRISSPKLILLSQVLLLVVILNFRLYITLFRVFEPASILKLLNWFYHPLTSLVNLILSLHFCQNRQQKQNLLLLNSLAAPCSILHHLKPIHYCLSIFLPLITFICIFHAFYGTQIQSAPFIWFSLVVCHLLWVKTLSLSILFGTHSLNMLSIQIA